MTFRLMGTFPRARALCLGLALVLSVATPALAYQFFLVKELEAKLPDQVNKQIKVVDKLVKIWEYQEVEGYLRFDTHHFRCAIPASETEGIAYLRELMKAQEGVDKTPDATPPLIAIYGTVRQPDFWGKAHEGRDKGIPMDQYTIVADKVEKPRARFFEEPY